MHVLLVEDDPLLRETVVDELTAAGLNVLATSTAEDALIVMAFEGTPPVVLTDVDLGSGMSGLDFIAKLRTLEPDVNVIVITGRPECLSGRRQHRRERHFPKPVGLQTLRSAVTEMLVPS